MSAVPNDVRERCRTLLLQGMKNVYKDKQEDYLRSLVMRFEQEKLFDMHKDLPSYLANANAKLQQVDKNTALLTVSAPPPAMPVLAMPAASLSPAAEQEYWRVRGELAAKYLPHLRECVTHMNRVRSALSAHHQVTAASLVAHADKVIQVLEQKLNGTLELPKLELNCQKCISAARQIVSAVHKAAADKSDAKPATPPSSAAPAAVVAAPPSRGGGARDSAAAAAAAAAGAQRPAPGVSKETVRAALAAAPREKLAQVHAAVMGRLRLPPLTEDPLEPQSKKLKM